MCNMVVAVEGDLSAVYALTPDHVGTIAVALRRAGFKPARYADAARQADELRELMFDSVEAIGETQGLERAANLAA